MEGQQYRWVELQLPEGDLDHRVGGVQRLYARGGGQQGQQQEDGPAPNLIPQAAEGQDI